MKELKLIDKIQTAVAAIDKEMTVIESNDAYKQRINIKNNNLSPLKCYTAAYNYSEGCSFKTKGTCPVTESFATKKPATTLHHVWIEDHAIVE